jgi:hypothetical protein
MLRAALLTAAALTLAGCEVQVGPNDFVQGSGHVRTEARDVHDFDRVDLAGSGSLVITQGPSETLTITSDDNVLPKLRSDVTDRTLHLGPRDNTSIRTTQLRYQLAVKQLRGVSLAGSGELRASALDTDQLDVNIAGSAVANLARLTATDLRVSLAGSGAVDVAGEVARQRVAIAGSGSYRAGDLASRQATVTISGSGDCDLRVSDSLDASVLGSGSIRYAGSPAVTQRVVGSGSVSKAG